MSDETDDMNRRIREAAGRKVVPALDDEHAEDEHDEQDMNTRLRRGRGQSPVPPAAA